MSVKCTNHCCGKKVDSNKEYHSCALCKTPIYCSSDCQKIDWTLHSCSNAFQVPKPSTLVAVPYFYEDTMTERDLENVPPSDPVNAAYSVMCVNSNQTMEQWTIEPVVQNPIAEEGRGLRPTGKSYTVEIRYGDSKPLRATGNTQNDSIYHGNLNNAVADELAGKIGPTKEDAVYVFWPKIARALETSSAFVQIPFSVALKTDGGRETVFEGYVPAMQQPKTARRVQQHLQSKLEIKGKRGSQVFRATNAEGHSAILTMSLDQKRLLDVEIVVRKDAIPPESVAQRITARYMCNSKDVSEVVGLTMALEKVYMDNKRTRTEQFIGQVRNYAQGIASGEEEIPKRVSNAINAAIGNSVDTLFSEVAGSAQINEYFSKIGRGGPDVARQLAVELTAEVIKARDAAVLKSYRTGAVVNKINDLMVAVIQAKRFIEESCPESKDIALYDEVIEILNRAKNPLQRSV